jgi:hypothetical protein
MLAAGGAADAWRWRQQEPRMIDTGSSRSRRCLTLQWGMLAAAVLAGVPSSCSGANQIISFGVKTQDNWIFPYLNEILRFQPEVNIFWKIQYLKKKIDKLFIAVTPTSIVQLSILSIKTIKKLFLGDFWTFIENYTRNYHYR